MKPGERDEEFFLRFWTLVTENMMQWNELKRKEYLKVDLRENYIATQGDVIQAIGSVGNGFFMPTRKLSDERRY